MATSLEDLLKRAVDAKASDVHFKVGSPPVMRIDGELHRMQDLPSLKPTDTEAIAQAILNPRAAEAFRDHNEADFAFGRSDLGRFRVNVYRQRGSVSLVMRRVLPGVPSFDRLGLPPIIRRLAAEPRGLVLVSGPTGSGLTTTMAAIIEQINATRPVAIVTIEDPIEILFPDKMAVVTQREVGVDTAGYGEAVRRAMRQDADVLMLSEVNEPETASAALAAAETGHLVVAGMHTADPVDTISRFVDFFEPASQRTARTRLGGLLKGIVSQRLVDAAHGGRVLACEILTVNQRVSEVILAGTEQDALLDMMRESEFFGMQTFDQALLGLVEAGQVALPTALPFVRNTHEFRAKAMEAGVEA